MELTRVCFKLLAVGLLRLFSLVDSYLRSFWTHEVHRSERREFARSERRLFTRSDRRHVKDFVKRVGVHAKT